MDSLKMVPSRLKNLLGTVSRKPSRRKSKPNTRTQPLPEGKARELESTLGYRFANKELLHQSLTHPSYLINTGESLGNNQRLEFLGDSVIQLVLTETLYKRHPREREGKLTSLRSGYARGGYMAGIARELRLGDYLILKPKDRQSGVSKNDSALADAFEALVGAVYLDSDFETTRKIVLRLYKDLRHAPSPDGAIANPKGRLQELVQPLHGNSALRYQTTGQSGNAHERVFEVTVYCFDRQLGVGSGRTKKEASEKAALQGIQTFAPES